MKRRGFLKGLAAAVALAPVVAEQVAEAAPVPPPEAFGSGYAVTRWLEDHPGVVPPAEPIRALDDDEAARDILIERLKQDPAVQEALNRRILERLDRQYPLYVLDADGVRLFDG